ncbi:hypothetical protein FA95DRAFT_1614388, partial [Auriscalpium vulgare]
ASLELTEDQPQQITTLTGGDDHSGPIEGDGDGDDGTHTVVNSASLGLPEVEPQQNTTPRGDDLAVAIEDLWRRLQAAESEQDRLVETVSDMENRAFQARTMLQDVNGENLIEGLERRVRDGTFKLTEVQSEESKIRAMLLSMEDELAELDALKRRVLGMEQRSRRPSFLELCGVCILAYLAYIVLGGRLPAPVLG